MVQLAFKKVRLSWRISEITFHMWQSAILPSPLLDRRWTTIQESDSTWIICYPTFKDSSRPCWMARALTQVIYLHSYSFTEGKMNSIIWEMAYSSYACLLWITSRSTICVELAKTMTWVINPNLVTSMILDPLIGEDIVDYVNMQKNRRRQQTHYHWRNTNQNICSDNYVWCCACHHGVQIQGY